MCRLFALHGGGRPVRATFWLLDAPESLERQSRAQPDGFGIGTFEEDGRPEVDKGAMAAYEDEAFAAEARDECSRVYVAHLRFASTGPVTVENSHPFEQHGRLFAHNGVLWGLPQLEERLGPYRSLVQGQTDSERFFALLTGEIDRHGGDVEEGIRAAVGWAADNVPVFALNFVLATSTDLWALRYPETNPLWVLEREACDSPGGSGLHGSSAAGTLRVRSEDLASCRSVIVATERMDRDHGWRELAPGQLLHVAEDLDCRWSQAIERPPAHQLTLADLDERAAASQLADTPSSV